MRRAPLPFAILALVSCGREPGGAPVPGDDVTPAVSSAEAGQPIVTPGLLAGEYRVAGVGGTSLDLPYGITASITAERIRLTADCVNAQWSYRFEGEAIATQRMPVESCARGLAPDEEALFAAFDGADRVARLPSGAYEFTGAGPQATLFTQ